jgi:hypothetical protein
MKNTKITYSQNLKNYGRSVAIKNYHLTNRYDELNLLYSSNIGDLLDDCFNIFNSLLKFSK